MSSKGGGGNRRLSFLDNLYKILDEADPSIITWNEEGTVIIINDRDRLSQEILGKFFRSNNYESFVRQLSFYQFRRTGLERVAKPGTNPAKLQPIMEFINDKFTRDNRELGLTIKRKTYGVDDVKEKVLELKSDMDTVKGDVVALRSSLQQLGSQFEEMRRVMFQVLQNQQHLHNVQQRQMRASGNGASGREPERSQTHSQGQGHTGSNSTIPPKPFGQIANSLDTPEGASGSLSSLPSSGVIDGRALQNNSADSFGGLGSQSWGGSFALGTDSPSVSDGAGGATGGGLGEVFSNFDDLTLANGSPAQGDGGDDTNSKRLRGRGPSALYDTRPEAHNAGAVTAVKQEQIDELAGLDDPFNP